ncbi:MAG: hypothetical protein RBT65_04005 [Methanolobus sp.]|nr:hypothetical protein [Methanolobus sp.]
MCNTNPHNQLNTPILFLVFNRLDTTKKTFEEIKKTKPLKLYIASDGSRKNISNESLIINTVRNYVLDNIDWNCEVKTLFHEENLGCKIAVSSAIEWLFSNEEMGIILEDDCLPSFSFFLFCDNLLKEYKDDSRIMMISGTNLATSWKTKENDYFYSRLGTMWGWATWKRAWKEYDEDMKQWKYVRNSSIYNSMFGSKEEFKKNTRIYEQTYEGLIDTWDYQWVFARQIHSGLTIVPSRNLISNIGFGNNATHTLNKYSTGSNLKRFDLSFPLKINSILVADNDYDRFLTSKKSYTIKSLLFALSNKIKNIFN